MAHRQQFYFWKNYRNNRLKHILPRPLPEPPAVLPASAPPQQPMPPVTATTIAMPAASALAPVLSPMQYANPPGSSLTKTDMRNSVVDRRKRKYAHLIKDFVLILLGAVALKKKTKRKKRGEKITMWASILMGSEQKNKKKYSDGDMLVNCYRKDG